MSSVMLTVVLPVLNESRHIGRLLDQLESQEAVPGDYEVIVVDGGSTDGTRDLVSERAGLRENLSLLANPKRRSGPARNIGVLRARGTHILYLDGHCFLPRVDFLKRHIELFGSLKVDCLCRPQPLEEPPHSGWGRAISRARHSRLGHNPGSDIYSSTAGFTRPETAGAAYRIGVLRELGGYDERFDACEDVELNHRVALAGYTAYKHPDLAVAYKPRGTLRGLFRQMARYGRGRAHLMARHSSMTPWPLVGLTVGFTALVLSLPVLGIAGWLRPAMLTGGAYVALCLSFSLPGTASVLDALRTAVVFPILHAGLALGFLRGIPEMMYYRVPPGAADSLAELERNATVSS